MVRRLNSKPKRRPPTLRELERGVKIFLFPGWEWRTSWETGRIPVEIKRRQR